MEPVSTWVLQSTTRLRLGYLHFPVQTCATNTPWTQPKCRMTDPTSTNSPTFTVDHGALRSGKLPTALRDIPIHYYSWQLGQKVTSLRTPRNLRGIFVGADFVDEMLKKYTILK
ncbi:hypothetical protein FOXYSP1_04317 [Fusarium oxysporum f. sp. phaseoli]